MPNISHDKYLKYKTPIGGSRSKTPNNLNDKRLQNK
jgi:hypothetical protein